MVKTLLIAITLLGCRQARWQDSEPSKERLIKRALSAIEDRDALALKKIMITEQDFRNYIWPELPAKKNNAPYDYIWSQMAMKSGLGIENIMNTLGGIKMTFRDCAFEDSMESYSGFTIYSGAIVRVEGQQDLERKLRVFGSIVERAGEFKILSYR